MFTTTRTEASTTVPTRPEPLRGSSITVSYARIQADHVQGAICFGRRITPSAGVS